MPGADQSITLPGGAALSGTVSDDGLPVGAPVSSTWSKVSGPGSVTFADPAKPATTATFGAAGSYTLRLTGDDTARTSSDDVVVTVDPAPLVNAAPTVDAGADQSITLPGGAALSGTVSDDGLPVGAPVSSTWSKVSGPGSVTFADPAKPATTATFGAAGSYTLRLTGDDTARTSSDDVVVTVDPAPLVNAAPTVDAGRTSRSRCPVGRPCPARSPMTGCRSVRR